MGANSCAKEAATPCNVNRTAKKASTLPRHNEINQDLARKICKDSDVPRPDA
jgi:hypothetical protein